MEHSQNGWMGMPQSVHPNATEEVEIATAAVIIEIAATPTPEEHGLALIGG
jgi:hypothetical protein